MTALPEVPPTDPAMSSFLQRVRSAIMGLTERANTTSTSLTVLVETSSTITLLSTDELVSVNAGTDTVIIGLPPAVSVKDHTYTIKKVDASANAVTIDPFENETIDGAATYALATQWEGVQIRSTGKSWLVVSTC